ncbi:hypothetical protein BJX63DRAFT_407195 [Aspergillus granulosus]|uniref:DUF7907 domain-containing protein n=1 Tax=Aspergillus granulosus TaxID=176169 RepID=A0ABR4H0J8_9EURO
MTGAFGGYNPPTPLTILLQLLTDSTSTIALCWRTIEMLISGFSAASLLSLCQLVLSLPQGATPTPQPYRYYLKSTAIDDDNLYLSSSITYNGRTNYVLLTNASLAQPLTLYAGDGSIILDTSNVIGASSQAPLYLSEQDGLSSVYKQVVLGDQKSGEYTKGFEIEQTGELKLNGVHGIGGFVACSAALGVKQVYWYKEGAVGNDDEVPVTCEVVGFKRVWEV